MSVTPTTRELVVSQLQWTPPTSSMSSSLPRDVTGSVLYWPLQLYTIAISGQFNERKASLHGSLLSASMQYVMIFCYCSENKFWLIDWLIQFNADISTTLLICMYSPSFHCISVIFLWLWFTISGEVRGFIVRGYESLVVPCMEDLDLCALRKLPIVQIGWFWRILTDVKSIASWWLSVFCELRVYHRLCARQTHQYMHT